MRLPVHCNVFHRAYLDFYNQGKLFLNAVNACVKGICQLEVKSSKLEKLVKFKENLILHLNNSAVFSNKFVNAIFF